MIAESQHNFCRALVVRLLLAGICIVAAVSFSIPVRSEVVIVVAGPDVAPGSDQKAIIAATARAQAADLTARGGISGEPVRVVERSDGCAGGDLEASLQSIVSSKPTLVLGHPCIAAALAASQVYAKGNILFIATAARHPRLTDARAGPTVFRLAGRDDAQGAFAGRYLAIRHPGEQIAIVHDGSLSSVEMAQQALGAAKKAGSTSAYALQIDGGRKDYATAAEKLMPATAIFYAGYPMEAGLLLGALRRLGSRALFLASDAVASEEFTSMVAAGTGDVMVLKATGGVARPFSQDELVRAAILAFADAVKSAPSFDGTDVARILQNGHYLIDGKPFAFTERGDASLTADDGAAADFNYAIQIWNNREWMPVSATER